MIARALTAELPFKWVTADEAYGQVGRLRSWLEEHHLAHVLTVPKSQMVISMDLRQRRAHTVIADLAEGDWHRLGCGDGAHGQRLYDWAAVDIRPWREPGYAHWLLARRSITDPDEIAYYLCYTSATAPPTPIWPSWCASPVSGGQLRNASKPRRTKPASTTTKSADTRRGIGTSPCPWPPPPSSSSPETPRKKGLR